MTEETLLARIREAEAETAELQLAYQRLHMEIADRDKYTFEVLEAEFNDWRSAEGFTGDRVRFALRGAIDRLKAAYAIDEVKP